MLRLSEVSKVLRSVRVCIGKIIGKCRQTFCSKKSSPATNAATLLCHCLRLNESGDPAASNVTNREVHQTECVGSRILFRSRFSKERIVAQRSSPTVFVPIFLFHKTP